MTKFHSLGNHRLMLLCAIAAILVLSFSVRTPPAVHAQCRSDRDCDGVLDTVDRCPDQAGPPENYGCPVSDPDSDGDGLPDSMDRCPNEAGPRENGGCPREEPTPVPPPAPGGDTAPPPSDPNPQEPPEPDVPEQPALLLPYMPEDGPCVIATQDTEGVNIRMLPGADTGFVVIGGLDPELLYPVLMSVETTEGQWWMLKQGGFVAGWVTRQGGDCSLLPTVQVALAEDHFLFNGHTSLDPDQPGLVPLLLFFDKTGAVKEAWFVGFGSPGEIVGFDPQPDPPGDDVSTNPSNDKQPPFFLMLSTDDWEALASEGGISSGDEAGIIIIGGKPSGDEAGFVVNWLPSGDEAGFVINWLPAGDEAGFVIDWLPGGEAGIVIDGCMPSGDEAGIVIEGCMPSGDEAGIIIDGGMPSGDEAGIVVNWLPAGDEAGIIINWLIGDSGIIINYVPGDGSVVPGGESVFCDGSVMPGGSSLNPTESVMPGDVAVMFCDGSVMPGDSSLNPTESVMGDEGGDPSEPEAPAEQPSWLLPAMVFPAGGGEAVGCSNNLLPPGELGGPDTSPAATCFFSNGNMLATCQVGSEEAFCAYSSF